MNRIQHSATLLLALLLLSAISIMGPRSSRAANGSVSYTYDALGRITTANYDTGVCIAYTYDANGNRTSQTISVGGNPTTPTWGTGTWGCFFWTP